MKSGLCAAAIFLCVIFQTYAAHSAERPDLRPLSGQVLRQRIARLNPDALMNQSNVESIKLQLFDNVQFTAVKRQQQKEPDGFMLWTGEIRSPESGRFVLVVRNGLMFASAYLRSSIIQIRPVNADASAVSQNYIVREIACPWRSCDMSQTAGKIVAAQDRVCPDCNSGIGLTPAARKMVVLVNLERKADGLPALEYDDQLTEAARRHTRDMALHDNCSHQMADGEQFYQNVFDSGYPVGNVGENVAAGIATPEEAFECLLSSREHRSNIMNSDFTQIGVSDAVNMASGYRYFWAQEFGAASAKSEQSVRLSANRPPT
ncbi:MAG: CAP domain-containing protein [Syntrophobacteraceae bacterium]|nr:CAP domain-containing protein [Syntrophobacteraceae bacterium]